MKKILVILFSFFYLLSYGQLRVKQSITYTKDATFVLSPTVPPTTSATGAVPFGQLGDTLSYYFLAKDTLSVDTLLAEVADSIAYDYDNNITGLNAFGATICGVPLLTYAMCVQSSNLVDNTRWSNAMYLNKPVNGAIGFHYIMGTAGDYTADEENGVALYSVSGNTATLVEKILNADMWKSGAGVLGSANFATPRNLEAGMYYIDILYNNSAQATAPGLYVNTPSALSISSKVTGGSGKKIMITTGSQSAFPASYDATGGTAHSIVLGLWLYK